MARTSDEFEQMIARIHELLEGEGSQVEWNEHIPDPDNPGRLRQIDVVVRKDGFLGLIECRIHKSKQNVKWVEELIGRRISLKADAVVAVSSNGFTGGAIKKAAKHGIVLRDLLSLSDDEIRSWSRAIRVSLFFYKYEEFEIFLYFDSEDLSSTSVQKIAEELKDYHDLRSILTAPLEIIDGENLILKENRHKTVRFAVQFRIDGFHLQGKAAKEIEVKGKAALERMDLHMPLMLAYGPPSTDVKERNVYVQTSNMGQTSIVHHQGLVSICLDLSKLDTPPYWQFRFFETSGDQENYIDKLEIISPEKAIMKVDKLRVKIVTERIAIR
jgi:hypothetical protein